MENEQQILQRNLVQFIVKDVFRTITEDDVLKKVDGHWTHKGQPLTEGQINILKKEATAFRKTHLNTILMAEIRWWARESFEISKTTQEMVSAKLLGFFADIIESKIKKIELL